MAATGQPVRWYERARGWAMAGGEVVRARGAGARWRVLLALAWLLATLLTALGTPAPAAAAAFVVTAGADTADGTCDGAHCSLREAITAAEANPDADTITFAPGVTDIVLDSALPTIRRSLTIRGSGVGGVTIRRSSAGGTPNFLLLNLTNGTTPAPVPPVTVTLEGLTLQNGRATGGASAASLYNFGIALTVRDSVIAGGQVTGGGNGGGYYQARPEANYQPTSATLITTTIRDNTVTGGNGGGVYLGGGTLTLTNTTIHNNTAGNGSGIYQNGGTLEVNSSTIRDNDAGTDGGGVNVEVGTATLTDTVVRDNTAATYGGGINNEDGTLNLSGGAVSGNTAHAGGGIRSAEMATLTNTTVSENTATGGGGGGIYNALRTLEITNSTIRDNSAGGQGGGIFTDDGEATLTGSTVSGNTAPYGGGIDSPYGKLTVINSTVSGNDATGIAGGINTFVGELEITSSTISDNSAGAGGGVSVLDSTVTVSASIVAGNTVSGTGADCGMDGGTLTSLGYNVVGSGGGCPSNGANDQAHAGTLATLIAPLANNGGPTQTHALPLGSPALDRVPVDQCVAAGVDQRGTPRPQGPGCDSGAFEYPYFTLISGPPPVLIQFPASTIVTLTPLPDPGQTFVGWTVNGTYAGWAAALGITMNDDYTVAATYVATKRFTDVPGSHPAFAAITELASRGYILGYDASTYGPNDGVQRAQMAALISRATPAGPGTPTNGTLAPPACTVAGTWDCEDWGTAFTDPGGIDPKLWRNAGTLQHYQVALGYTAQDCAAKGRTFPCYGPTDSVSHAQTIAFITRAMIAKGYWVAQPTAPLPDASVPGVLATEARTYAFYTGSLLAPPSGKGWNDGATRGWFAMALWQALNSYWGTDAPLADGRPAGGMVP